MSSAERIHWDQKRYWGKGQSHRRRPEHPVIHAIYEPRARFLRSLVADITAPSILDVGCGTGVMTHYLQRHFAIVRGVDFSETMLSENRLSGRLCADAAQLPFRSRSFDLVTCSHLLHHMPPRKRLAAVEEFGRVARRWVVLYEPNRNNPAMFLFGLVKKAERMSLVFSRRYMVNLAKSAGLGVKSHRAECTILPNKTPLSLLWLARLFDRRPMSRMGFYTMLAGTPLPLTGGGSGSSAGRTSEAAPMRDTTRG